MFARCRLPSVSPRPLKHAQRFIRKPSQERASRNGKPHNSLKQKSNSTPIGQGSPPQASKPVSPPENTNALQTKGPDQHPTPSTSLPAQPSPTPFQKHFPSSPKARVPAACPKEASPTEFPPLSSILSSPPSPVIFPSPVAPDPVFTPPDPSILANEIQPLELIDILLPPPSSSKPTYTPSSPPRMRRNIHPTFRHTAFDAFRSPTDDLPESLPSASPEGEDQRPPSALPTFKPPLVPFNVSDPGWTPSIAQIALLKHAMSRKDTFEPTSLPSTAERKPISRSLRRARYKALRSYKDIGLIYAEGETFDDRLFRSEKEREARKMSWADRIKQREDERRRVREMEQRLVGQMKEEEETEKEDRWEEVFAKETSPPPAPFLPPPPVPSPPDAPPRRSS